MLTLPNLAANLAVLDQLEAASFDGQVAAVARFHDEIEPLEQAGASTVFNVYAEAGAGFAEHVAAHVPPGGRTPAGGACRGNRTGHASAAAGARDRT